MARLSNLQRKRITKSFPFTRQDFEEIRLYGSDWGERKLKPIKDRIRSHYKKEQNSLCAFCRLPFRDDIQIDHLVPKEGTYGRREYAFYSRNLACACKHCNNKKSTNNDLIPWTRSPYPHSGHFFKIIHPHLDDYFDHIAIVDDSRYVSRTSKGWHTIHRCKLYDTRILEFLATSMKYQDDPVIQGYLRIKDLTGDFRIIIDRLIRKTFG